MIGVAAQELCYEPAKKGSLYLSHGYSCITTMQALLTFEHQDLAYAIECVDPAVFPKTVFRDTDACYDPALLCADAAILPCTCALCCASLRQSSTSSPTGFVAAPAATKWAA